MAVIVQKYGGATIESIERLRMVAEQIYCRRQSGDDIVVVVSAMGRTTDDLLDKAYRISPAPDKRELAVLMSTGEQVSIALLSIALNHMGAKSVSYTGQQLDIKTQGTHIKSRIIDVNCEKISEELKSGNIVIVTGFQGINEDNEITTLGRGGSDSTAVALAARLEAACEIYSDVDGVYTIDPKLYPSAKKLACISYEEMLEISSSGAALLQPQALELAEAYKVPITVSLYTGCISGTVIKEFDNTMQRSAITGLAVNNDEAMVTLNGIPHDIRLTSEIFGKIAGRDINIDMISQTTPVNKLVSITFTLPKADLQAAVELLENYKSRIPTFSYETFENITKLSVVGLGMNSQPGVAAKLFGIMAENDIAIHTITTSEIKISYIINPEDQDKAVEAVANEFDL